MRNLFLSVVCKCREFRVICLMCCANGAEFVLFTVFFLEFSGFTSRLLAMGTDSANFTLFVGAVGELRQIWLIHSNFLEFSVDGQKSESSELDVDKFCLICWNFKELSADGQASEIIMVRISRSLPELWVKCMKFDGIAGISTSSLPMVRYLKA